VGRSRALIENRTHTLQPTALNPSASPIEKILISVPSDIEIVPVLNVAVGENYSQRGGGRPMATDGFVIAVSNKSKQAFTRMGKQLGPFQVI